MKGRKNILYFVCHVWHAIQLRLKQLSQYRCDISKSLQLTNGDLYVLTMTQFSFKRLSFNVIQQYVFLNLKRNVLFCCTQVFLCRFLSTFDFRNSLNENYSLSLPFTQQSPISAKCCFHVRVNANSCLRQGKCRLLAMKRT